MGFRPPMDNLGDLTVDNLTVNNQFTFENLAAGNVQVDGDIEVNDGFVTVNGDTQLATLIAHRTGGLASSLFSGTLVAGIAFQVGGAGFTFTAEPQANILNGSITPNFPVLELGKAGANTFLGLDFVVETTGATDAFFMDYSADTAEFNVPLTVQGADAQIFEVLTSTGTRVFSVDTLGPANVVVENIDFRVDTDNITDAFFIDESEDTISIGDINDDQNGSYFQVVDGDAVTPGQSAFIFNGGQNAATGAVLKLQNLTPTPAPNTNLAGWQAIGLDDGGNQTIYAAMGSGVVDDTDGSETSYYNLLTLNNGGFLSPRISVSGNTITLGVTAGDTVRALNPELTAEAVTPDTTTVAGYLQVESGIGTGTYRPLFAGTSTGNIPDGEANYPINGLVGVDTGADKGLYINYGSTSSAEYRRIQVEGQGADVASATNLSISSPYSAFEVTGTTNIESIPISDIQNGRIITLVFAGSLDVVNNASPVAGGSAAIITKSGSNVSVTTDDVIRLQLLERGGTRKWYEI